MRDRSTLAMLDDLLLVAVITVVAAFVAFHVIGWVAGFVLFLVKLAAVVAIAGGAFWMISGRRHRELTSGRRRRGLLP